MTTAVTNSPYLYNGNYYGAGFTGAAYTPPSIPAAPITAIVPESTEFTTIRNIEFRFAYRTVAAGWVGNAGAPDWLRNGVLKTNWANKYEITGFATTADGLEDIANVGRFSDGIFATIAANYSLSTFLSTFSGGSTRSSFQKMAAGSKFGYGEKLDVAQTIGTGILSLVDTISAYNSVAVNSKNLWNNNKNLSAKEPSIDLKLLNLLDIAENTPEFDNWVSNHKAVTDAVTKHNKDAQRAATQGLFYGALTGSISGGFGTIMSIMQTARKYNSPAVDGTPLTDSDKAALVMGTMAAGFGFVGSVVRTVGFGMTLWSSSAITAKNIVSTGHALSVAQGLFQLGAMGASANGIFSSSKIPYEAKQAYMADIGLQTGGVILGTTSAVLMGVSKFANIAATTSQALKIGSSIVAVGAVLTTSISAVEIYSLSAEKKYIDSLNSSLSKVNQRNDEAETNLVGLLTQKYEAGIGYTVATTTLGVATGVTTIALAATGVGAPIAIAVGVVGGLVSFILGATKQAAFEGIADRFRDSVLAKYGSANNYLGKNLEKTFLNWLDDGGTKKYLNEFEGTGADALDSVVVVASVMLSYNARQTAAIAKFSKFATIGTLEKDISHGVATSAHTTINEAAGTILLPTRSNSNYKQGLVFLAPLATPGVAESEQRVVSSKVVEVFSGKSTYSSDYERVSTDKKWVITDSDSNTSTIADLRNIVSIVDNAGTTVKSADLYNADNTRKWASYALTSGARNVDIEFHAGGGNDTVIAGFNNTKFYGDNGVDQVNYTSANGINGIIVSGRAISDGPNSYNVTKKFLDPLINVEVNGYEETTWGKRTNNVNYRLIGQDNKMSGSYEREDSLFGVEIIIGTDASDAMFGGSSADTYIPGNGADLVKTYGGNDMVILSPDKYMDRIETGDDDDIVSYGGKGDISNWKLDLLDGGAGEDTLSFGDITGLNNIIISSDQISNPYKTGADSKNFSINGVDIDLSADNINNFETIIGSKTSDFIRGSSLNETLVGNDGADYIHGGGGDDSIYATNRFGYIWGGTGNDKVIINLSSASSGWTTDQITELSSYVTRPSSYIKVALMIDGGGQIYDSLAVLNTTNQAQPADAKLGVFANIEQGFISQVADVKTVLYDTGFQNYLASKDGFSANTIQEHLASQYSATLLSDVTFSKVGVVGVYTFIGSDKDDFVIGGGSINQYFLGSGDDIFYGGINSEQIIDNGDESDYLYGRGGDDIFNVILSKELGIEHEEFYDGGSGNNVINFSFVSKQAMLNGHNSYQSVAPSITRGIYADIGNGYIEKIYANENNNSKLRNEATYINILNINSVVGTEWADYILGSNSDDTVESGLGTNYISLLDGNDTAIISGDADEVRGGEGYDTFEVTRFSSSSNLYYGDADVDHLSYYSATNASTLGGIYFDLSNGLAYKNYILTSDITAANIIFTSSGSADVFSDFEVFSGTQNDDAFIGDSKNNTFYGKGGNDYFYGGNGDNKYILNAGKNIVKGGQNDDHVVLAERNYSSILLGGAGFQDILDFSQLERSSVETGVYVNGVDGYFLSNIPESSSPLPVNLFNLMDEFEIYLGSNKDDIFIMGDSDDTVYAGIGSDYIKTGKGNNWILATINLDFVESDTVIGESDASDITVLDYSNTNFSNNQLIERHNLGIKVNMSRTGGSVEKYVTVNNNIATFNSDIVDYISGINQVITTDYNDIVSGSISNDYIITGLGDDIVSGLSGNDTIIAGDGNDFILGDEGDDVFYGSLDLNSSAEDMGYDTYDGGIGTDALSYQSENFTINQITARGGLGIYVDMSLGFVAKKIITTNLHGTVSKDFSLNPNDGLVDIFSSMEAIVATSLDDVILGSDDIDIINAGNGADFVISGLGNDFVIAGLGSDTISLGGGDDRVLLTLDNIGQYTIYGGDDIDTIEYSDISEPNKLNDYNFGIIANLSSGRVDRYNGSDSIADIENVIGSIKSDLILGNLNNNLLSAGEGDDYIFGNSGDDSISGGIGADILSGGNGNDTIYDEDGMGIILDGAGSDTMYLGIKDSLVLGSMGNDLIRKDQGSVLVSFNRNSGTDVVYANKLNTNASSIIISVSDNINLDDLKLGFHLTDTSLQKSLILSDGTSNLVLFDYLDVVTNNLSIILQLTSRDASVKEFDFYDVKVLAQLATNSDPAVKSVMFKDTKNSALISSSNNSVYGGQWAYQEMMGLELSEPGMHAFWDLANTTTQPLLSNKLTVSDTIL